MNIKLPVHVALVARDATDAQLQLVRARATIDRRWRPEVARLEAAISRSHARLISRWLAQRSRTDEPTTTHAPG
jgi:hypothetical protein